MVDAFLSVLDKPDPESVEGECDLFPGIPSDDFRFAVEINKRRTDSAPAEGPARATQADPFG